MSFSRICLLLTIGLSAPLALAQEAERPQDAWLERAKDLTDNLLKDGNSLVTLDRAVVLAQLGAQWWTIEPNKARKWIIKAVEAVEYRPAMENIDERNMRLSVARTLLTVISSTDQRLAERLQAVIAFDEGDATDAERTTNANALVEVALAVLKTDPIRAASIGSAALRVGRSSIFHNLLVDLRLRDTKLADNLFRQALAKAEETFDVEFLNSLKYAAFPELHGPGQNVASDPPDALRRELLRILTDYLQLQAQSARTKPGGCGFAPGLVAPLQAYFDQLLPQRAELVRQLVRTCQESINNATTDTVDNPAKIGIPETVDSLLSQADQTPDKKTKRPQYLALAARLAAHQKNLELAIKILESMAEEERKYIGMWETWRRDWAAALAIEFMKRNDVYGMRQVIKAVPNALQPFAKIIFVSKLPKDASIPIAQDFLDESRKDLPNCENPDLEKVYWYLLMVRLYSQWHLDSEAVGAFKDGISSLNRAKKEDTIRMDNPSEGLNTKIIQADFPVSVIESHDYEIGEVVSSIMLVSRRARVRLDLLEISLKEYQTLAARFPPEKKAPARLR